MLQELQVTLGFHGARVFAHLFISRESIEQIRDTVQSKLWQMAPDASPLGIPEHSVEGA